MLTIRTRMAMDKIMADFPDDQVRTWSVREIENAFHLTARTLGFSEPEIAEYLTQGD